MIISPRSLARSGILFYDDRRTIFFFASFSARKDPKKVLPSSWPPFLSRPSTESSADAPDGGERKTAKASRIQTFFGSADLQPFLGTR
jgi:hypothetical protein